MTFTFPQAAKNKLGYDPKQVDAFISAARAQFNDGNLEMVNASGIRNSEFDLIKGGYQITAVDTAMDRLEDAFASREMQRQKQLRGEYAVKDRLDRIKEIVKGRLERPKGKKFSKSGFVLRGYDRKQVDALCDEISSHLSNKTPLQPNAVRRAVFRENRNGYSENQVDAFIDRVVEVIQLEKNI